MTTAEVIPRKYLPAFLLLSLRRAGTSYGYELSEMVGELGLAADLAAVYRALRKLDQRGLVIASWQPSDSGPDRRVYALTEAGHRSAADAAGELASLREALTAALDGFDVLAADQR